MGKKRRRGESAEAGPGKRAKAGVGSQPRQRAQWCPAVLRCACPLAAACGRKHLGSEAEVAAPAVRRRLRLRDSYGGDAKEGMNAVVARAHGPYGRYGVTHAVYLDGCKMRTTRALLAAESGLDWPPAVLHIPNSDSKKGGDYWKIAAQLRQVPVRLYQLTSTQFLQTCASVYRDGAPPPDGFEWLAEWVRVHGSCGSGPFSLVYLDYCSAQSRAADVDILLSAKLLTRGVVAVTSPAYRLWGPDAIAKCVRGGAAPVSGDRVVVGGRVGWCVGFSGAGGERLERKKTHRFEDGPVNVLVRSADGSERAVPAGRSG
eukprot:TRINITY_DN15767_c0_g1_i2.p1 TRINITY_DN15767_c0_g1~~TRINITY_DN15767_c0_g1_i2.p1  ORF type:complete len:335 (+),score=89.43 TRINITY_DN15767_c0_g1_i2:60-1007(+)